MRKVLISFLICFSLMADTNVTDEEPSLRDNITNGYHKILNSIDCYLASYDDANLSNYKKISKNKLYMVLSLKDETGTIQGDLHLRGRIKLPQLEDKFEITFSKQAQERRDNQLVDTEYEDILKDNKLHVGLKYYAYKDPFSNAYAKLSLRVHSPVGLYAKIGINKSYFYQKLQTIFEHALYYYIHEKEYALSTSMTLFLPLNDRYGVEQQNRWYKDEGDKTTILEHSFRVYHSLSAENKLRYQLTFATIDNQTCNYCKDWYGANIKFRHHVNQWLFFEIIPEIMKRRENSFKYEQVLTANFGVTFSK